MSASWQRFQAALSVVVCLVALNTGCGVARSPQPKTAPTPH